MTKHEYEIVLRYYGPANFVKATRIEGKGENMVVVKEYWQNPRANSSNIRIVPFGSNGESEDHIGIYELVKVEE